MKSIACLNVMMMKMLTKQRCAGVVCCADVVLVVVFERRKEGMSEHQEISLDAAVRRVRQLVTALDEGAVADEGSAERQAQIQRTIELCRACRDTVERGGFFSANEELDDVPTHSLLLLLLPFYSAMLATHVRQPPNPTGDARLIVERTAQLAAIRHELRAFVEHMRALGVLASEDCATTLAMLDAEAEEIATGKRAAPAAPAAQAAARTEKVQAYKRKKAVKALLDGIAQRSAAKRKQHRGLVSDAQEEEEAQAAAGRAASSVFYDGGEDEEEFEDEEAERQQRVTALKYAALVALDELAGVVREEAMLTQIARMKMQGTFEAVRAQEAKALAAKKASGQRPFTITAAMLDRREQLARDVFKPFNPATLMPDDPAAMAADDALDTVREEERRRAAGLPAQSDEGHRSEDDDSDKETDESLRKAREWDEFKDSNPRGWGNRINMG